MPPLNQNPASSATDSSKSSRSQDEKWQRKGLFRFVFTIQTLESKENLGSKEAHDHAFSNRTSNWGWAQFAKRESVYYKQADVIKDDGFLITVTITATSEKPKLLPPVTHPVPPVLIQAMGSLLDDPEHSDVVFYLPPRRRRLRERGETRKVYAIRKILAARSEYFRDMFESGFCEAEAESSSEDEGESERRAMQNDDAHPHGSHDSAARADQQRRADDGDSASENYDYDLYPHEALLEDSDEEIDEFYSPSVGPALTFEGPTPNKLSRGEMLPFRSPGERPARSPHSSPSPMGGGSSREDLKAGEEGDEEGEDDNEDGPEDDSVGEDEVASVVAAVVRAAGGINNSSSVTQLRRASSRNTSRESVEGVRGTRATGSLGERKTSKESLDGQSGAEGDASMPTFKSPLSGNRKKQRAEEPMLLKSSKKKRDGASEGRSDRRKRRKVIVPDSAYPTFKALLFFLYTDTVEFAPLTSSYLPSNVAGDGEGEDLSASTYASPMRFGSSSSSRQLAHTREDSGVFAEELQKAHQKRKQAIENYVRRNPGRPTPCSAKAMYKLADKLQIPDLKKRAQEHIEMSLTVGNIVWEVFSGFNTQYPDIRKMETDFLLKHWRSVKRSTAMKTLFSRASAHPGLAEVWPHLLACLEYKEPKGDEEVEEDYE